MLYYILLLKFNRLNFDGLAGRHQNVIIFPCQHFVLYGNHSPDVVI